MFNLKKRIQYWYLNKVGRDFFSPFYAELLKDREYNQFTFNLTGLNTPMWNFVTEAQIIWLKEKAQGQNTVCDLGGGTGWVTEALPEIKYFNIDFTDPLNKGLISQSYERLPKEKIDLFLIIDSLYIHSNKKKLLEKLRKRGQVLWIQNNLPEWAIDLADEQINFAPEYEYFKTQIETVQNSEIKKIRMKEQQKLEFKSRFGLFYSSL